MDGDLGLGNLLGKDDVYLHDKDFLSLFYMKQNPDFGGQYMFVPRKKHTIVIEEVKLADHEWNNRYSMVQGPIDESGSPWIALSIWGHPGESMYH